MNDREIPNDWTGNCFGCSRKNTQGLRLRFWLSEEGCFTKCTIPDHLCGLDGVVHGGIVTVLLEEVAAWMITACLSRLGITREISVRYLKPTRTNAELLVFVLVQLITIAICIIEPQLILWLPGKMIAN